MHLPLSSVPERLRSLRVLRGYSQAYMGQCLQVSQKTYSRWENDAQALSPAMLNKICQVLGTGADQLTGADPDLAAELRALRAEVCAIKNLIGQLLPPPPRKISPTRSSISRALPPQSPKLA